MAKKQRGPRLRVEAIVIGYAMSRLDTRYLEAMNCKSWTEGFKSAAIALGVSSTSVKNLRDEFDPIHDNSRRGWHQHPLRPNRQRVLAELCEVSDSALLALVERILRRDEEAIAEAIDSLASPTRVAHNVAERLRTGRLAEEFFLSHSSEIVGVAAGDLVDCRLSALGYDFGVRGKKKRAIEVKGLKESRGQILFTDREWNEAQTRTKDYWLVVVGNLARKPRPRLIRNPATALNVTCRYQASVTAVWHSTVSIAE